MDFIIYSKHTFCYDWDVAVILKITWGKLIIEMQIINSGKTKRFENRKRPVSSRIVTADYLLGLTENREQHQFPVEELGLDDETVDVLKSGKLNVRLQNKGISDEDHYMKTLETATISEDNYFNNLLGNDIVKIAKAIRDAHSKDAETGDATTPVDDILDSFEELKTANNATQTQMVMYSKLFKINFTKMDPYKFKTFTDILQRYSDLCKPVKGNGRGKKKITRN